MAVDLISPTGVSVKLEELLHYDPAAGRLIWLPRREEIFLASRAKSWNTCYSGKPAFEVVDTHGYHHGHIFSKKYLAHRVIWALVYGEWPSDQVDHINGRRDDNRLCNLRIVSNADNQKTEGGAHVI